MPTSSTPDPITGGQTGNARVTVTLAEMGDALRDTTRATIWWGNCAHSLVPLWLLVTLSSLSEHPRGFVPLVVFAAGIVIWVPFSIARRRRWTRLGRRDPQLPAIAIAAHVAAIALTIAVTVSLDLSLWLVGAALTAEHVLLFALTRRLVLARAK
jgi:hypothetical protein